MTYNLVSHKVLSCPVPVSQSIRTASDALFTLLLSRGCAQSDVPLDRIKQNQINVGGNSSATTDNIQAMRQTFSKPCSKTYQNKQQQDSNKEQAYTVQCRDNLLIAKEIKTSI